MRGWRGRGGCGGRSAGGALRSAGILRELPTPDNIAGFRNGDARPMMAGMWSERAFIRRMQTGIRPRSGLGWRDLRSMLLARLDAERDRWALWLPVGLGTGVGVYFMLAAEPPLWLGGVAVLLPAAIAAAGRRRPAILILAIAALAVAIGFAAAQLRTVLVATPLLTEEIGPVTVVGTVVGIEALPAGQRVVLADLVIEGIAPADTPRRIRIRIAKRDAAIVPGQRIDLLAELGPTSPPVIPGGFDFQRAAFFRGIGAQGFAYGGPRPAAAGAGGSGEASWFRTLVETTRQHVVTRIRAVLPDATGGVAAALMTGTQAPIPEADIAAMRIVGLAHLLSVSGLHIGLVTGFVFFVFRAGLALLPAIALRYPIKKWAAIAALLSALAYLYLTGESVPTQRSFLMAALVLIAVLIDRTALSMRLIAWAAAVVVLLQPDAMLGPSFQLSFAAVVALIAAYEASRQWWTVRRERAGVAGRILGYLAAVAATTVIAEISTAPFALYHFNQLAPYGLVANMIAVPLTALWIMPWVVVAYLLMPLGLEALALVPMGWGIDLLLLVARWIAQWPGAADYLPAISTAGLLAVTFGGLWLAIWRGRWRIWGTAPILAGFATMAFADAPEIVVSGDARLVAVAAANGEYVFSSARAHDFEAEIWMRRAAQEERLAWPEDGYGADGRLLCDALGCLYRLDGRTAAIAWRAEALLEDCAVADLVVSLEPAHDLCVGPAIVIDRFDMWRNGGYAIWIGEDGLRVQSVGEARGDRPWVAQRDFGGAD
jgi:competence protein ComEC